MSDNLGARAGSAYLVRPGERTDATAGADAPRGPGVLLLPSWWGLTPGIKAYAERLADHGFVVLVPDLLEGRRPETAAEAELELAEIDPNATAALLLSSVVALRSQTDAPTGPVSVVGFSMGASWALWLATRQPDSVGRVVAYYGTQHLDFSTLRARVLGHFAEVDDLVPDHDLVAMEAELFEHGHQPEIWHYPGTRHFFAEVAAAESHDADAADLAWLRTLDFLRRP